MSKNFQVALLALFSAACVLKSGYARAAEVGVTEAPMPRILSSSVRLIPVAGASSFTTADNMDDVRFEDGFSAGVLADFGPKFWTFETGILGLNSVETKKGPTNRVTTNTWGVPLLAKLNFSGKPQETVFLKAGAMPFGSSGAATTDFDVMAVGGIGGHLPIGRNSSLLLDASYNRLFTKSGDLDKLQGFALLAGLSMNL